jgi:hypothetical protein
MTVEISTPMIPGLVSGRQIVPRSSRFAPYCRALLPEQTGLGPVSRAEPFMFLLLRGA